MNDIEKRRAAAYAKLEEVVNELSFCSDVDDPDSPANIPTAWVLCVGFDCLDECGGDSGMTAAYPRDGAQASWKTLGILNTIIHRISG